MKLVTIRIPVTQKHLDASQQNSFQFCAIAEAMKAVFNNELFGIWDDKVEFISGYQLALPDHAIVAIRAIDTEQQIMPFSFVLEIDLDRFHADHHYMIRQYELCAGPTRIDQGLLPEPSIIATSEDLNLLILEEE